MEKIQEHALLDTWRITEGILLKVYKYKNISDKHYYTSNKKKIKKLDFYELTDDIVDGTKIIKKGSIISQNGRIVEATDDTSLYHYEVRFSGGIMHGKANDLLDYFNGISLIMSQY